MTALDTNVLVRLVVADDAAQARRAAEVMRAGPVRVSKTVILETAWVLAFTYDLDRRAIADAFRMLLALASAEVEDRDAVVRALRWFEDGLDFADALHLASIGSAVSLTTFDRPFARRAARIDGAPPVRALRT